MALIIKDATYVTCVENWDRPRMINSGRRALDAAVGGLDAAVGGRRAPLSAGAARRRLGARGRVRGSAARTHRDARSGRLWWFRSFSSQPHYRNYRNYLVSATSHFETRRTPAARGN